MLIPRQYIQILTIYFLLAALAVSCALPGSAMGTLQVRGDFPKAESKPSAILVTLPASYGLGSSDQIMGDPGMFGHEDKSWKLEPDENGRFSITNIETIYHVTVCLLPPLGAFPEHPPLPFFVIRFPENDREVYLIEPSEAGPTYRIMDPESKKEIPLHLADWSIEELEYSPIDDGRGWLLTFTVTENGQTP